MGGGGHQGMHLPSRQPCIRCRLIHAVYAPCAMNHMDLLTGCVDISRRLGVTSPDYGFFRLSIPANRIVAICFMSFSWAIRQKILYAYGQVSSQLGRWRLLTKEFQDWAIPFPSLKEQATIATFLDHETAKIDALIAEQESLIELLQKKRQAVISHAVTKGVQAASGAGIGGSDEGFSWWETAGWLPPGLPSRGGRCRVHRPSTARPHPGKSVGCQPWSPCSPES